MTESLTHTLTVNQMRAEYCFAYLIADTDARDAALIDPRADRVEDYLRDPETRGLRLRVVIETHTNADHISGAADLRARTGADVLVSDRATSEVATGRLRDGDRVSGRQEIQVLASPGHTGDSYMVRTSSSRRLGHDVRERRLDLLCDRLEARRSVELDHGAWLDGGELGDAAFLIDGDPAGQGRGDFEVRLQHLLGLVGVADLKDPTLAGEFHALLGHLGLEVVDAKHAELVASHGRLEVLHDAVERLA